MGGDFHISKSPSSNNNLFQLHCQPQKWHYFHPSPARSTRDAMIAATLKLLTRNTCNGFGSATLSSAFLIQSMPGPPSVRFPTLLPLLLVNQLIPLPALNTAGSSLST